MKRFEKFCLNFVLAGLVINGVIFDVLILNAAIVQAQTVESAFDENTVKALHHAAHQNEEAIVDAWIMEIDTLLASTKFSVREIGQAQHRALLVSAQLIKPNEPIPSEGVPLSSEAKSVFDEIERDYQNGEAIIAEIKAALSKLEKKPEPVDAGAEVDVEPLPEPIKKSSSSRTLDTGIVLAGAKCEHLLERDVRASIPPKKMCIKCYQFFPQRDWGKYDHEPNPIDVLTGESVLP